MDLLNTYFGSSLKQYWKASGKIISVTIDTMGGTVLFFVQ